MIQTVERRILHIVDDIDNINATQMAIEPGLGGIPPESLDDFYDGGFGVKTVDGIVYRFSKFNDIHYTKSVYMTNNKNSVVIGGAFYEMLGDISYPGDISEYSVNIGNYAGLINLNGQNNGYGVYIGFRAGSQSKQKGYDVAIGYEAGKLSNGSGSVDHSSNIFFGYRSGTDSVGYNNINMGRDTGKSSIGNGNINIGRESSNLSSSRNNSISIGNYAGKNSIGEYSVYMGFNSGYSTSGSNNTGIGAFSLMSDGGVNTFADSTAIGYYAGFDSVGNGSFFGGYRSGHSSTGPYNVCIGYEAGYTLVGSGYNVCIGYRAGNSSNSTSINNVVIGRDAGSGLAGSDNVLIGRNSKVYSSMNSIPYGINNVLSIFSGEYSGSQAPLIAGDFVTGRVNIQKILNLTPQSSLPALAYEGDILYNTTTNKLQYRNETTWVDMGGDSQLYLGNESGKTGWWLLGDNRLNKGNIGTSAIDLSYSAELSTTYGATGNNSFSEGVNATASGDVSHAEGYRTSASGPVCHAEGHYTIAIGYYSHAEGSYTSASGDSSHSEGYHTKAIGPYSHAEGSYTSASGPLSHAEGYQTSASGEASHAEGAGTIASGINSHAEGSYTIARGERTHSEGGHTIAWADDSHAEGYITSAFGGNSHAGGYATCASGENSFTHGDGAKAIGTNGFAIGFETSATGEGVNGSAFACGQNTLASGEASHAEGHMTSAAGEASHTEGWYTRAEVLGSHAEGYYNTILASAPTGAHVEGQYAFSVSGTQQHVVGIGTGPNIADRKNGFEVHTTGLVRAPEVSIAEIDGDTTNKALITKEYLVGISTGSTGFTLPNETGIWSIRGQLNHADVGGFNFTNRDAGWTFKISELIGNATGVMTPSYRESTVLQGYNSDLMIDRYVNITLSHRLGSLYWGYDGTITSTSLSGPRVAEVRGVILLTTTTCDVTFSLCTNINLNLLRLL